MGSCADPSSKRMLAWAWPQAPLYNWVRNASKNLKGAMSRTKKTIKTIIRRQRSLKFKLTTSKQPHSASAQQPKVTVIGKLGRTTGYFDALPYGGKSLTAHIPFKKNMGEIQQVIIEASGRDGWLVDSISVQRRGHKWQKLTRGPCEEWWEDTCEYQPFWVDSRNKDGQYDPL